MTTAKLIRKAPGKLQRFSFLSVLLVFLCGGYALSQVTSGTIFGTAKDPSGALLANATVTVANPANGVTRTVTTSENGSFIAPNLPPGKYIITVEAPGFQKLEKTDVMLSAADRLNAGDFVLSVGTSNESVTVAADVGQVQLQSNSGERSDVITGKQLNDVAINGRNVLDYMKLIPGVSGTFDGHASGTGGIDSFSINGSRTNQHEFTIDGASNVDTGNNGGTHVTLNTDAIEEVKVLTSNYQAEYGKAAGGQIAIITKSGSNQWHGNGRFFHRNESLNANEWFNKANQLNPAPTTPPVPQPVPHNDPPLYRYNYIGYQLGGPIKKDKLFAFWSQEFYRQLIPIGGNIQFYTPTALERQGDFSQSIDGDGNPIAIAGPGITNNVIDPAQINTQVQTILNLFPLPNASGFNSGGFYNYSVALSGNAPRREDILRVDYQLNGSNRLYGRWIHNSETDSMAYLPFPGPFGIFACSSPIQFPGGCTQSHPGWNFAASLLSTITPTILNEFSVGPSHTLSIAESTNGNVSRGKNGITMPLLFPLTPDQSIPDMGFSGLNNINLPGSYLGGTPWRQANTTINVNDNLTWVLNKHALKTGVFYQRNRKDQVAWGNINGQFNFGTGPTAPGTCPANTTCGDPFASALLGEFNSFDQATARPVGKFRYNQLEFYVQDTWKILSNLTLDYGMRFAWIPPQYDASNQVALFDPSAYNPANAVTIDPGSGEIILANGGDPLNGMRYTKNNEIPDGGWNSRGIMLEPRFGFAYDLLGRHNTILRGGFGMMHDRTQGNLIFNTVFNNPAVVQTPSVSANNIANLPFLSTSSSEIPTQGDGGVLGAARDGQVPTIYSFSFGVQHELTSSMTLDLAYVGSLSRHLVTSRDINAIPYGFAFTLAAQDPNACGWGGTVGTDPYLLPEYAAAGYSFSGICALGRSSYINTPLVPFKGYSQIPYLEFNGTSNYNSLQASLQRRFAKGLTLGAVYTWSKSLTTATADQDTQDTFNPRGLDYRAAGWDRTHVFALNYVYNLPNVTKHFQGPKWLSYVTDNFQLSGVTQVMSGTPVDLNNAWHGEPGAQNGSNMWGAIPLYFTLNQSLNPIYPTIGAPLRGTRDFLRNGGMQNWDMSLFKNFPLGGNQERYIQLRLEAFNVFNHPNFNDKIYGFDENGPYQWQPGTPFSISRISNWGANADTYGSGPGGFRVLQLAAKIYF
ncbi:MAG TPA: carboxypeptidase regulatory-like domain-containing protein [Terriglobales bacterium]|nr:carboxypeptidase regulatory-like domain-containing protein [Terriglobales bacterium]